MKIKDGFSSVWIWGTGHSSDRNIGIIMRPAMESVTAGFSAIKCESLRMGLMANEGKGKVWRMSWEEMFIFKFGKSLYRKHHIYSINLYLLFVLIWFVCWYY